ncbi:MAG: XTP/dITP diphosphatase [Clostridiaceae bacterium]|nr:XTP/dITP diphosphatase [Clostridiaceae bacterium]
MKKLIVASNNEHKIIEIKQMLSGFPFEVISLKQANIDVDVEETGTTFEENSYIKAKEIFKLTKDCLVLSDDSGLMVDSLDGAPGVYSARFAGEHGNSKKNNEKLLLMLQGKSLEERKARFVCVLVLIIDKDKIVSVRGEVEGYIAESESGKDGFGYDPLFYVPEQRMTFAEMGGDLKNSMSHRGRALEKLQVELSKLY